ncbi:MAG: GTPase ObgE [Chloroflexi bacterium]|nr:GTPase ObgE [Chloroflexota bacterium]
MDELFLDETKIHLKAGDGGDGIVSFRREKFIPFGGPDGGHGGRGGEVVLVAERNLNTLNTFRRKHHFKAESGTSGGGNNRHGKDGAPLRLTVPVGTMVRDPESGELLADLTSDQQEFAAARGGRGGRGNSAFAKPTNQAPRVAERGEPGEERWLRLELRLIADVGLIGVPNAGKSTLLSIISNARPKIADYPFTTLAPNLGVVVLNDEAAFVAADIPGLIEGAHEGRGLGDRFLRHIERTRLLVHLLDGNAENPLKDFAAINAELEAFSPALATKPQIVVLNKMDLPSARAAWPKVKRRMEKNDLPALAISAATHQGVQELVEHIAERLAVLPVALSAELPVLRPEPPEEVFTVSREGEGWRVRGKKAERLMAMTYWDEPESVERLQRILEALGVFTALREAGVQEGEMVHIGAGELEWTE